MANQIRLPITDAYVHVQLLNGGSMTAEYHKLHAGEPAKKFRLYNWAFYIYHPTSRRHIIWDLGLSSIPDDYPPVIANGVLKEAQCEGPRQSIAEQIERRNGVRVDEIDTVILSHAHFDHCRPIRQTFSNATAFFGPGTSEYCSPGHLADPSSAWDGRYFDPERATERWEILQGPWVPLGPFSHAMDFLGDGSFWVIQAPGHMPALLDGTKNFGSFKLPDGSTSCLHVDISAAKDTLARIRETESLGVHVALAHDTTWIQKENDPVLLSLLDEELLGEIRAALRQQAPF
ncbi:hypothetical protein N7517_002450 [Penicillium concentricum]|uniref:Metallo-beta-lactamase domain-containing protein n=1 Tax=Penicillium concentricum TaxID=293559 RepID=A0A9W9SVI6_9EURO|nr:uncharacterized protein N7517_002450 [Penicillium concentricum]KAJ5384539.1 hypothetical protein N7517_002450 [Penicillium concentricum]